MARLTHDAAPTDARGTVTDSDSVAHSSSHPSRTRTRSAMNTSDDNEFITQDSHEHAPCTSAFAAHHSAHHHSTFVATASHSVSHSVSPFDANQDGPHHDAILESDVNPFEQTPSHHQPTSHMLQVAPMLNGDVTSDDDDAAPSPNDSRSPEVVPSYRQELKSIVALAVPAVLVNLLFVSMSTGNQMIVGHISSDALATAVCANLAFNVLWFFTFGFAGALDTLAAQTFTGGSLHSVHLWMYRAIILVTLLTIPTILMLCYSYGFMHNVLGQSAEIALEAQTFCRWLALSLWPFNMSTVFQKFLQAQSIQAPIIYIAIGANLANVAFSLLFIWVGDLGAQGGAIGMSVARWIQFFATLIYVRWSYKQDMKPDTDAMPDSALREENTTDIAAASDTITTHPSQQSTAYSPQVDDLQPAIESSPLPSPSSPKTTLIHSRISRPFIDRLCDGLAGCFRALVRGCLVALASVVSFVASLVMCLLHPTKSWRYLVATYKSWRDQGVFDQQAMWQFTKLGISSGFQSGLEVGTQKRHRTH